MATKTQKPIASFEAACKKLGINPKSLPQLDKISRKYHKSQMALYKLTIIAEALNDGWVPNWMDHSQYKYFPWLYVKSNAKTSASGFSYYDCADWSSYTTAPGRLYYKNSELATYAGKKFIKLYRDLNLI